MMSPDLDRLDRQKRKKRSKCSRGLPGWSNGPASEVRRLTGSELQARARELGAVVSVPRKVSQRAGESKPNNHKALAVPMVSHGANVGQPDPARRRTAKVPTAGRWSSYARWQHLRLKSQARFFDIDRPERAAAYAPGTGLTIEAAEGDRP
jgi:hypothetical protein